MLRFIGSKEGATGGRSVRPVLDTPHGRGCVHGMKLNGLVSLSAYATSSTRPLVSTGLRRVCVERRCDPRLSCPELLAGHQYCHCGSQRGSGPALLARQSATTVAKQSGLVSA